MSRSEGGVQESSVYISQTEAVSEVCREYMQIHVHDSVCLFVCSFVCLFVCDMDDRLCRSEVLVHLGGSEKIQEALTLAMEVCCWVYQKCCHLGFFFLSSPLTGEGRGWVGE